jgi:probable HAF family extracellular repeat protein
LIAALVAGWCLIGVARQAGASVMSFSLVDLGRLDGAAEASSWGIDASGRVAGYAATSTALFERAVSDHAVVWSGGSATDLASAPASGGGRALGLTSDGDVVGYGSNGGWTQALLWHNNSVISLLPALVEGAAYGVNDAGQVVGYYDSARNTYPRPFGATGFVWQAGNVTSLGMLPGDTQSVAYGINQGGLVVGYSQSQTGPSHAVAFSGSSVVPLGALAGDTDSAAFSVNGSGEAVGYSAGPAHFHAAGFCAGGQVVDLGTAGSDLHSEALSINSAGIAVGDSDLDGSTRHAVVFGGGRAVALDKLVSNLPAGWRLARATAVNDRDTIAAEAVDAAGVHHAAELVPSGPIPLGDVCTSGPGPQNPAQLDGADAPPVDGATVLAHWDYMVLAGPDGFSEAPNPQGMGLVQQAFARQHLKLWVDPSHHAIPERNSVDVAYPFTVLRPFTAVCTVCGLGDDYDSFYRLKAAYFHPVTDARWHYAMFINQTCPNPTADTTCVKLEGGQAVVGGKDLVVAHRSLRLVGFRWDQNPFLDGGSFMHELGHTLGLLHGGDEDFNDKPNYLSVMNYAFELSGIPYAATPGSAVQVGTRLDYSGQALPDLNENSLNEQLGLQSGTSDLTYIETALVPGKQLLPTTGPVDYNSDGNTTDSNLSLDLTLPNDRATNPGCANLAYQSGKDQSCLTHTILRGFNDWAFIKNTSLPGDITITSRHSGAFPQNGTGSYQLTVTNDGTQSLSGCAFSVSDLPPPGWTITSISGSGWFSTSGCSRSDSLAPGAAWPPITVQITGGSAALPGENLAILSGPNRMPFGGGIAGNYPSDLDGDWTDMIYAPPTVTSFSPTSGTVGRQVTISGAYLANATAVQFGSITVTLLGVDPSAPLGTTVTVTVPDGATSGPLTVITPYGQATTSQTFTVIPFPPTISGFSPTSGPPGTSVTITGTYLANPGSPTTVVFAGSAPGGPGGAACSAPAAANPDGSISAVVPSCASTGGLTVTTAGGQAPSLLIFTVLPPPPPPPTIAGFGPSSGLPGQTITITGTNLLTAATTVTFGTSTCPSGATGNPDGSISAVVPACATTGPIGVTTDGGTALSASTFTVDPVPPVTPTGFSPTSGTTGTVVTITGSGLVSGAIATTVAFASSGSCPVVTTTDNPDGSISVAVPACAASGPSLK